MTRGVRDLRLIPIVLFTMIPVTVIGAPLAIALARRIERGGRDPGPALPNDVEGRLDRMEQAIDAIAGRVPSLILLDWMMPRMDGFQFAQELDRRGLRPGIPLILLTADGSGPQKAARVGAESYFAKPFDLPRLLDEVARLAS